MKQEEEEHKVGDMNPYKERFLKAVHYEMPGRDCPRESGVQELPEGSEETPG